MSIVPAEDDSFRSGKVVVIYRGLPEIDALLVKPHMEKVCAVKVVEYFYVPSASDVVILVGERTISRELRACNQTPLSPAIDANGKALLQPRKCIGSIGAVNHLPLPVEKIP